MGIKKKYAKGRLDKYYYMAKEQGYRARSAFKLIQLNKKYNFLEKSKCLVDLCAAPGGWLQVAAKYMPKPSIIVGLDLAAIKPIPGVITHQEDITTSKCRATLKKELKTWKADVFLHDGAPNVGASWAQDAFTQSELVLASLRLAVDFLVPNGVFVTKVFRSKDYNKLLWVFNQLFSKVEATKPASSRNVSAEIFVVCKGFLAPKKIDPKLLDPKYVFKEVDDDADEESVDPKLKKEKHGKVIRDLLHPEKIRREREGYEDGDYTLHVERSIADFVQQPTYLDILSRANKLKFNQDAMGTILGNHPLTSAEVKACCEDLKVLGRKEFKELLKWRDAIRLDLGLDTKKGAKEEEEKSEQVENLEEELESAKLAALKQAKREKRKSRDRKARQLLKLRLGMGTPSDIGLDAGAAEGLGGTNFDDRGLFHMSTDADTMRTANQSVSVGDLRNEEFVMSSGSDDSEGDEEWSDEDSAADSDEENARKVDKLEAEVDGLMDVFKERKLRRNPKAVIEKRKEGGAAFEEWYGVAYDRKANGDDSVPRPGASDSESSDSDSEDDDVPARRTSKRTAAQSEDEMDVDLDTSKLSKRARVFFDNPLFQAPANGTKRKQGQTDLFSTEMVAGDSSDDDEEQIAAMGRKRRKEKQNDTEAGNENDFEVVSSANLNAGEVQQTEYAINTATAYTMAQQLVHQSGRRDLIDSAYNRYAFHDGEGLPSWFTEEEGRHNKPTLPVTKEAVAIIRQRMKALDARPIKKIAEAKFRKQMRTQRRMEKMLKKTAAMTENDDDGDGGSEKQKLSSIAKMVKRAKAKPKKKEVAVVVAKGANRGNKGRPKGTKGRYKMVDPRMKKETRAAKRIAKNGKSKR